MYMYLHGQTGLAVVRVSPQCSLEEHVGLVRLVLVVVAQSLRVERVRVVTVTTQELTTEDMCTHNSKSMIYKYIHTRTTRIAQSPTHVIPLPTPICV